ncbi:MAG: hypothetical protein ACFFD4_30275 [Candidatus Odinarchaeota archaeon]
MVKLSKELVISEERKVVFEKILEAITSQKRDSRPFVIGITGIDASGKTLFAKALGDYLQSKFLRMQFINLDDFHNPQKIRYSGEDQAESYYSRSFDIKTIVEKLLLPIHQQRIFKQKLTLLDLESDSYRIKKEYIIDQDTVVIFEGVFLYRNEFAQYIDYKIHLDITFDECKKRAEKRDSTVVLEKYDTKYIPAQIKYLTEHPPEKIADMVIDNNDWRWPVIKKS